MKRDPFNLSLLLDYYGALLPEKQRTYCDLSFNQDYSLTEIAEYCGISRQGVHDALTHAEASLLSFESVLGCVARDIRLRENNDSIQNALDFLLSYEDPQVRSSAQCIADIMQNILE